MPNAVAQARVSKPYEQLPLSFEANMNQVDPQVKLLVRGGGHTLFLTSTEMVLSLPAAPPNLGLRTRGGINHEFADPLRRLRGLLPRTPESMPDTARSTVVHVRLEGANANATAVGLEELPGKVTYFIQIAVGGGYKTVFSISNTGATTASGNLALTDQQGGPLAVSNGSKVGSSFPLNIPSGGSLFLSVAAAIPGDPTAQTGWARLETWGGSLTAVGTFEFLWGGTLQTIAGVLQSQPTQFATIPVNNDVGQEQFTGYAIANPTNEPITVKLALVDTNGALASQRHDHNHARIWAAPVYVPAPGPGCPDVPGVDGLESAEREVIHRRGSAPEAGAPDCDSGSSAEGSRRAELIPRGTLPRYGLLSHKGTFG